MHTSPPAARTRRPILSLRITQCQLNASVRICTATQLETLTMARKISTTRQINTIDKLKESRPCKILAHTVHIVGYTNRSEVTRNPARFTALAVFRSIGGKFRQILGFETLHFGGENAAKTERKPLLFSETPYCRADLKRFLLYWH